jgi:ankyrin repeat protein
MTPLILATKAKNEEIISILLNAGADLDLQTEDVSAIAF